MYTTIVLSKKIKYKRAKEKQKYLLLSCYLSWSLAAYKFSYFKFCVCHFWEIWAAFSPRKASLQLCRTTQLPNTSISGTHHPQNLIKLSSEHTENAHNKLFSTTPAQLWRVTRPATAEILNFDERLLKHKTSDKKLPKLFTEVVSNTFVVMPISP